MNKGYLPICLCLQFLSSKSCSFQYRVLSLHWLHVVPGTLLFLMCWWMKLLSLFLFWMFYCWCTETRLFFLYIDLLNLLISVSRFLEESLGFPLHNIIASANKDSYPAFFSIRAFFISFSSLTVLARIFSTLLNRRETIESWAQCLVHILFLRKADESQDLDLKI